MTTAAENPSVLCSCYGQR